MSRLKNRVQEYLLKNPIDDFAKNKYDEVCKKFRINIKTASRYWLEIKDKSISRVKKAEYSQEELKKVLTQENNDLRINVNVNFEVRTLEDLFAACEVDTKYWQVVSWQCKKWEVGAKNTDGELVSKDLYSVSARFKPLTADNSLELQKEIIKKELFTDTPDQSFINTWNKIKDKSENSEKYLLELALFDMHFGKLAHREEVGEDYDLKIAVQRYKDAVFSLLGRINLDNVDRILFPIGQDLINIDNIHGSTTAGTPQDTDSRFHKIVKSVKAILIDVINTLVLIAPVDVVIVVGNHDEQTTFMIGEMLEAYYHNTDAVNVYNDAALRKYYKYGVTGIMFSHGNREKFNELGMIFAAENPKLWAETKQRYIQIGHFHHTKLQVLQKQEFQGFQVQILPSLSGSDAWHKGKGFISLKQAKAFLYDREKGLIGEFTHTAE